MNSVVSFDSSKLTPCVHENELKEMQAMVNAADKELREGTGAGNDFRGWLDLPVDYDKDEFARIKKAAKKIAPRVVEVLPGVAKGAWVILRGRMSGVNFGQIEAVSDGYIHLKNARKIWYWNGAAALPEIAVYGVSDKGGTKITVPQDNLPVQQSDVSEVLIMQPEAVAWGQAAPVWRA